jgi:hypothetical protein
MKERSSKDFFMAMESFHCLIPFIQVYGKRENLKEKEK